MNRLPLVKDFIQNHAIKYNLQVNFVGKLDNLIYNIIGGDPRLVFFDEYDTEVLTINVADMNAEQISAELDKRGFHKLDLGDDFDDDQ